MARKPNYNFERRERERLKAEKKAKRAAEKKEAREKKSSPIPTVRAKRWPKPVITHCRVTAL